METATAETTATEAKPTKAKGPKSITKTELFDRISDKTGLSRRDVSDVFSALPEIITFELAKEGVFAIPGLLKMTKVVKPATEAKTGVPNPFKPGTTMDVKAKPAKNIIKLRPFKALKDMV